MTTRLTAGRFDLGMSLRSLPRSLALVLALAAGAASGCASPEPAPADLDGLARFFFDQFEPADKDPTIVDIELQDGFAKLHEVVKGDELTEPRQGILAKLTQAELDAAGLPDRDPSVPQGMFMANIIHCSLDDVERFLLEPDQLSLYPEGYAAYERRFDAGRPESFPTWSATYTSGENPLVTNQFTATVRSGLRKVPATDDARFGRALVLRVVLPEPATFEQQSDDVEFSYDFQVETYHERAPGEIVHFYGMWRYMKLGILGESYDGLFVDQTIGGMIEWDQKTDALCAGE